MSCEFEEHLEIQSKKKEAFFSVFGIMFDIQEVVTGESKAFCL